MGKSIRVFDYVNHSYESVRDKLTADAAAVFSNATKVAAGRAEAVASELSINIAGIEVGTDISISVKSVEEHEKKVMSPPKTVIQLEWEASNNPRLFPFMQAELSIYALTSTETQLELEGNYEPPLGVVGSAIDAVVGHRIAEASVHKFIQNVAVYLRSELNPGT